MFFKTDLAYYGLDRVAGTLMTIPVSISKSESSNNYWFIEFQKFEIHIIVTWTVFENYIMIAVHMSKNGIF